MKLEELTQLLDERTRPGYARVQDQNACSLEFNAITEDSRRVTPGALFVAAPGERADGHDFVTQAAERGAIAVMGQRDQAPGLPYVTVPHAREALGIVAHHMAGDPSRDLYVIGVTGTNGKSSTVFLLHHILEHAGYDAAEIGTLGYSRRGRLDLAAHTTPFGEDLAEIFLDARESGCTHLAMEVSSHALAQERIAGIEFNVGVFTNLTQDHLDYHETMEQYCEAKAALFKRLSGSVAFSVVNAEDPYAEQIAAASSVTCHTYGDGGDTQATDLRLSDEGSRFDLRSPWGEAQVDLGLIGRHNVSNALAAITTAAAAGLPIDTIAEALRSVHSIPGRCERVDAGQNFLVIVDYAHTDDGLKNVLAAARSICNGRVIALFGCGGDRDRTKRPKMAAAVAEGADYAIITSDNPRTEAPERILLDVEVGIQHAGWKKEEDYLIIADRADAIDRALRMALPGDLVLLAGKGHEDYQIFGSKRIHFDDREVARAVLARMGYSESRSAKS